MAESVQQYEEAALERLYDGLELALSDARGQSSGSIYLFGYVIEMVLKAAFFRVTSHPFVPSRPVQLTNIAAAVGQQNPPRHDLALLCRALLAGRRAEGLALDSGVGADLAARIARASGHWSVDLRYNGGLQPRPVVDQMYEDAAWFYANRLVLAQ